MHRSGIGTTPDLRACVLWSGFARLDLTLISQCRADHQTALQTIDEARRDLGLEMCPDKSVSYCFDGEKSLPRTDFRLSAGNTRNISSGPTKFLGETISLVPSLTKGAASKKLTKKFLSPPSILVLFGENIKFGFISPT